MKRASTIAAFAAIALATQAAPAFANPTNLQSCINACDAQFPSSDYFATAIRGYCYIPCLAGY